MVSKPAASKAVATTAPAKGDMTVPDYLKDVKGSGLVGLETSDFVVPRIKLLQGTSPECTAHEDAKAGRFWLTVLDVDLGPTFDFMAINNKKRYLLIPPLVKGNDKAIFARADDAKTWVPGEGEWQVYLKGQKNPVKWVITDPDVRKSGLTAFGTSDPEDADSKPAATLFYDFLVRIRGYEHLGPVLLSLARSAAKRGKDLQGKIELRNKPMTSQVFTVAPTEEPNPEGEGSFYNWQFTMAGWASAEEYAQNEELAARFEEFRGADEADAGNEEAAAPAAPKARGEI